MKNHVQFTALEAVNASFQGSFSILAQQRISKRASRILRFLLYAYPFHQAVPITFSIIAVRMTIQSFLGQPLWNALPFVVGNAPNTNQGFASGTAGSSLNPIILETDFLLQPEDSLNVDIDYTLSANGGVGESVTFDLVIEWEEGETKQATEPQWKDEEEEET